MVRSHLGFIHVGPRLVLGRARVVVRLAASMWSLLLPRQALFSLVLGLLTRGAIKLCEGISVFRLKKKNNNEKPEAKASGIRQGASPSATGRTPRLQPSRRTRRSRSAPEPAEFGQLLKAVSQHFQTCSGHFCKIQRVPGIIWDLLQFQFSKIP